MSGCVFKGWIPNLGREHEFHLISGVSIFLTYLSQTAPEPLRFPPLVPMNEKPPFCPRLVLQRCGSAVIRSPTVQVRGENVVNLVNPGDCLKLSSVLNCLSVVMATNLAFLIVSLRSAIFLARAFRERESQP